MRNSPNQQDLRPADGQVAVDDVILGVGVDPEREGAKAGIAVDTATATLIGDVAPDDVAVEDDPQSPVRIEVPFRSCVVLTQLTAGSQPSRSVAPLADEMPPFTSQLASPSGAPAGENAG